MDIKSLRAMRNTDFSKIASEFDKAASSDSGQKSYEDTRFWKPERDKAGNASATIRFLPRTEGDELPWVKLWSHAFKGPTGRWYIENSLTTIGLPDPVSELNTRLWNSTDDDKSPERKQAREQKRKLTYIANILVVNDPKHPENNGKVFLFKFGKKIFDKIMDKAKPTFEDEKPVNVFDYWEGANFKLRMKMVDKYPNYDSSEFEPSSPIADSDEEIVRIAKQQHRLSEFIDPKNFKSYDELKKKLDLVLSGAPLASQSAESLAADHDQPRARVAPAPQLPSKPAAAVKTKPPVDDDDDDEIMSYFQSIADEE
jgi:hypothetical protein